jgi:hypothetical protein
MLLISIYEPNYHLEYGGKLMTKYLVALLLSVVLSAMPAAAQSTQFNAHITQVLNPQGAPISFDFRTDNTPSACNGFILYNATGADEPSKIANFNAVYATALAALLSGHLVVFLVNNPTSGSTFCTLDAINPTNQ